MKFTELETTYICQLSKPENRKMLEGYRTRKDGSKQELIKYYLDVIKALKGTPAWKVSGVNKMVNELTCKVRATLMGAKKGKTSAYAHAGKLISDINFFGNTEVQASYNGRHKLDPILTIEELLQLSTCGENI